MKEFVKHWYDRYSALIKVLLILVFGGLIGYRFYMTQMRAEQTTERVDMSIRRSLLRKEARLGSPENHYKVTPLLNRHYTSTLIDRINDADTSIKIMMYVIRPSGRNRDSRFGVGWILENLRNAMDRGVDVQMLVGKNDKSSPYDAKKHIAILKELKHKRFEGYVFPLSRSLHAKMVLIDDRTALIGAHNWTWHSLNESHETSVLLEGERRIRILHQRFDQLFEDTRKYYQRNGALP